MHEAQFHSAKRCGYFSWARFCDPAQVAVTIVLHVMIHDEGQRSADVAPFSTTHMTKLYI